MSSSKTENSRAIPAPEAETEKGRTAKKTAVNARSSKKREKTLTKKEAASVLSLLASAYPDAGCELDFDDTFQLICAVTLSAQTTDKRVNSVTPSLFEKYKDVYELAAADIEDLEEVLKPLGMYKNKSKNLLAMSRCLVSDYGGEVPGVYEELLKLPGVGRKTANVVLSVGFGVPRIAVDTHVFRVANRIGLVKGKNELETEEGLMKVIPESEWLVNHHRIIWHGRRVCSARSPKCGECTLDGICLFSRQKSDQRDSDRA